MGDRRQNPWWTSKGAIWVVLDRAVASGWGATFRLALLLAVLLVGAHLGAVELAVWVADSARALTP